MICHNMLKAAAFLIIFALVSAEEECSGRSCAAAAAKGLLQKKVGRSDSLERSGLDDQQETSLNGAGDDPILAQGEGEQDNALTGSKQNSICPQDAETTAVKFWTDYFFKECKVAPEHLPKNLVEAIASVSATVDPTSDKSVRCLVSSPGTRDGTNLMITIEEKLSFQSNWEVVDGSAKLEEVNQGHLEVAADSGPCSLLEPTLPRTMVVPDDIFREAKSLYLEEFNRACPTATELLALSAEDNIVGKRVNDLGKALWEVALTAAGTSTSSLKLVFTSSEQDGADDVVALDSSTSPKACSFCSNCSSPSEGALSQLAQHDWHSFQHAFKGDESPSEREFGLGDNFHETVMPRRTSEDHKSILALSEALVHTVVREKGLATSEGQSNLIANGNFEDGQGNPYTRYSTSRTLKGWNVLKGNVEVGPLNNYKVPVSGTSMMHLCGTGAGAISQQIKTTPGTRYQVSFAVAPNPQVPKGTPDGIAMTVTSSWSSGQGVSGTKVLVKETYSLSASYRCYRTMSSGSRNCWQWKYAGFQRKKKSFVATASTTEIKFSSLGDKENCAVLDDVWVTLPPYSNLPSEFNFFSNPHSAKCWFPAYNQGKCGSCWAFASVGALEKQYCARSKGQSKPSLSREMLVRCSTRNNACGGGNADMAYGDLMEIGGLWQTKCLPYQGEGSKHCPAFAYSWFGQDAVGKTGKLARIDQEMQSRCDDLRRFSNRPPIGEEWELPFTMIYIQRVGRLPDYNDAGLMNYRRSFAKARRHDNVPSWWLYGEEAMMAALNKYGALYGSFKVFDTFNDKPPVKRMCADHCWPYGQIYGEDGSIPTCGGCGGHAIQIIGYGSDILETEEEVKYWLMENSWGTGGHMTIFGSEPNDPFSYGYPTGKGSEEQCVLAVGAKAVQKLAGADGFELLVWIDGKPFKKNVVTGTELYAWTLSLESGKNHSVTFEINAMGHSKQRGIDVEDYSIFMPMLRCRGKGFRKDFLKDIDTVQLSWNKPTRKELIAKADEVLRQAGFTDKQLSAKVGECPSKCRMGRFSSTHPCVDYLTSWGRCSDSSYYASLRTSTNCTMCDQEKALLAKKGLMIKRLPNDIYLKWFFLINEALTAPDEAGWNKFGGSCSITTAGHNNHSRLNATYSFFVAQRTECSAAQTAPILNVPGSPWARPEVGAPIPLGQGRTVPCPSPLGGNVELLCSATGVLSVKSHSCVAQGGMNLASRGYYKYIRGTNYLGIESGAAFAIAELGVSSNVCPTKSWSRWSLCNATAVCEKGFQFRSRVPINPLTVQSPECEGVTMSESRPCMRPGFCPEVLARFSSVGASSPASFLAGYTRASTSLPLPSAGAHILRTIYPPCEELRHWCSVISGKKECTTLFQGQIHIPAPGAYAVEFVGSSYGMGSSVLTFSPDRGAKQAVEMHNFRVMINKPMEVWADKGELHRRRRAGKGGSEWQAASEARFAEAGKYMASVLLSGYRDCPKYTVKLHNRDAFKPAAMPPMTAQIWQGSSYRAKKTRVYSSTQTWKLNATEMYSMLGLNQYNPTLTSSVTIKGKTVLPGPGKYKVDLRVDMRCKKENAWMYCNKEDGDNTGYRRRRRRWDSYGSVNFNVNNARQRKYNCDNCIVSHLVDANRGQVDVEIEVTGPMLAGKRIAVGQEDGKQLFDTIPVANKRVLPNWFEVVWSKYDSTAAGTAFHSDKNAVDMGAEIKYESDIEIVKGEDLARITWPDRDSPLANEYQVQPFNATPPGLILLGKKQVMGFVAEAEGRVDAGACLSLSVEAPDNNTRKGQLKGFGLSVCDIDGDRQYLSLTRSNHGNEVKDLAWVHVEFQHPTRLRVMRDISKRTVSVAYRPDNRAHWASVWDDLNQKLNLTDSFFSGHVDVGVSMSTERAYRWSEFYNISIDECPTSCASLDGTKILRCGGKITTPCGDVLDCSAPCSNGGSCVESYCFSCPPENVTHKSWACGTREEVCKNDDGQIFEKKVPVGNGCDAHSYCDDDHTCKCDPETADSLRAVGYQCGNMADNCGRNVSLGRCNFVGMENSQCKNNVCTCDAEDLTSQSSLPVRDGWDCGTKSDGCGRFINFGAHAGMCPAGKHCGDYKCCTPAKYPATYECGKAYDACTKETTEFHGAMTNWKLMIKQSKGEWTRRRTYFRSFGKNTDRNYVKAPANYYSKSRMAKNLLDKNKKFTFKMVLHGANMPAPIIWKQLDFPSRAYCSGSAVSGFEHVSGPKLTVSDGWGGLCSSGYYDSSIWSTAAKSRRRRREAAKRIDVMQKTGATQGITTPYGKADRLEIYIAELPDTASGDAGGACPLPNDKCSEQHVCVCTKSTPVQGAECGSMSDGCGGTYNYPLGGSAPGSCQSGFACNSTTYRCEKASTPSIEDLRKCMKKDIEGMSRSLSNFFAMREGTYSYRVSDGGRDMYDGGLKLKIKGSRLSSYLSYTNQCDATWKSTGVEDIEYFTCKMNSPITVWFAGFRSASTKIKGLRIEGNLGADGRGSVIGGKTKVWPHGDLYGYYKEVYGTSDPSINHLVMVPDNSWSNTFPRSTDNDLHTVEGKATNMLFYMNFAGHKGSMSYQYKPADYEKVMNAVVSNC